MISLWDKFADSLEVYVPKCSWCYEPDGRQLYVLEMDEQVCQECLEREDSDDY